MEFRYRYKTQVSDLWQVSMYYAYSSFLLVVNLVFTVSAILLLLAFWKKAGTLARLLLILLAALFTVIQPLIIWLRARRQLAGGAPELELLFDGTGFQITSEGRQVKKTWSQVKQVFVKPTLVVLYVDAARGYILTNRVLKESRKEFLDFVRAHVRAGS